MRALRSALSLVISGFASHLSNVNHIINCKNEEDVDKGKKERFDLNYHSNNIAGRINNYYKYTSNVNCFSNKSNGRCAGNVW